MTYNTPLLEYQTPPRFHVDLPVDSPIDSPGPATPPTLYAPRIRDTYTPDPLLTTLYDHTTPPFPLTFGSPSVMMVSLMCKKDEDWDSAQFDLFLPSSEVPLSLSTPVSAAQTYNLGGASSRYDVGADGLMAHDQVGILPFCTPAGQSHSAVPLTSPEAHHPPNTEVQDLAMRVAMGLDLPHLTSPANFDFRSFQPFTQTPLPLPSYPLPLPTHTYPASCPYNPYFFSPNLGDVTCGMTPSSPPLNGGFGNSKAGCYQKNSSYWAWALEARGGTAGSSRRIKSTSSNKVPRIKPTKDLQCPRCPLAFARQHDLNRHDRIHTGAKPYTCLACNLAFRRTDARQRHWRQHPQCKWLHVIAYPDSEEAKLKAGKRAGRRRYTPTKTRPQAFQGCLELTETPDNIGSSQALSSSESPMAAFSPALSLTPPTPYSSSHLSLPIPSSPIFMVGCMTQKEEDIDILPQN